MFRNVFILAIACELAPAAAVAQGLGPIRASLEREGRVLAATLAAGQASERSNDWDNARGLAPGTRVTVSTDQEPFVKGTLISMSDDTLHLQSRRGRPWTIARADVREIRVGHKIGGGQGLAIGLLLGGVAGYLAGGATACEPHVCGGERGLAVAGGTLQGVFLGGIGGFVAGQAVQSRPGRLVYARPKT
jgi:hypothetical protein